MTILEIKAALSQALADYAQAVADIWEKAASEEIQPPDPEPEPPQPDAEWTPVPSDQIVTIAGLGWMAQSGTPDGVAIADDDRVKFHAASGEHASFDQPRKIRAELGGLTTFEKGVRMRLSGTILIDPNTRIANSEWCSIAQVHQADTRRSDGVPVASPPPFTVEVLWKDDMPILQVRAETSLGIPEPNTWPPTRILGTEPIEFGFEYEFEFEFVDGHGHDGEVFVRIGDTEVVNFVGPTGFEYVDLLKDAYPSNTTGSYWKFGVYAGKGSGEEPPPDTYVEYRFQL